MVTKDLQPGVWSVGDMVCASGLDSPYEPEVTVASAKDDFGRGIEQRLLLSTWTIVVA